MKKLIPFALGVFTFLSGASWAQSPVVVELFTSQGCSSCPPADKLMHDLATREDVIALALHVDYWDYIGWKDQFADPSHAKRQRGYAVEAGRRSVYTPQMIINGKADIVGARPMELSKVIAEYTKKAPVVDLDVTKSGNALQIAAKASGGTPPFVVHLVRYTPERTANITRGENAGRTLSYANVTEEWTILAEWDGATALDLTAEANGDLPIVVMVQEGMHGPIRAAVQLR